MQLPEKYFHKRLNSTNLYVSQMLENHDGTESFWVRTADQFAGRGQGDHTWSSDPGSNLTGSLAVFPDRFPASRQFDLSKAFALAGASFLELYLGHITIKWPNDLYAGDKKIGGILIETAIMGEHIRHAVLGIGININQLTFPKDLPNPVSISLLTGMHYDLTEMEDLFLESFRKQYHLIESGDLNSLDKQYVNRLYRFGEWADYKSEDKIFNAKILGINAFGHLTLQPRSGAPQSFAFQEIDFL